MLFYTVLFYSINADNIGILSLLRYITQVKLMSYYLQNELGYSLLIYHTCDLPEYHDE